jgi:hypothetical protein
MVALQLLQWRASANGHPRWAKLFPPFMGAFAGRGAAVASLTAGFALYTPEAWALPSYARQTDQPCATCHTAFPELTPYGRQFKLGGYTAGGTRCNDGSARSDETQVPLAVMTEPVTNTNVKSKLALPDNNNYTTVQQTSLFVGGQIYCNLGAFAQMTYDRPGVSFGWDNTDIRYARTGTINGTNIVYGVTANNNPTVQDVWNTTPAWAFPFLSSEIAPTPAASTMLQGTWAGRVGGTGAYVWIDNMIYAEFTAYGALDPRTLTTLGVDPTGGPRFDGAAPYWRLAIEKTWDKNSLMVGTFGMFANVTPVGGNPSGIASALSFPGIKDPFTDIGVDAQYQYIGDTHIFTVRASYIWERQKLSGEFANGLSSNLVDTLNSINASASYIYDRTFSFTTGYFSTWGSTDALLYANSTTGSPNSSGWVFDLAYLPFSKGGPDLWPWFNGRIGVTYTHYDKFDGSTHNVDNVPGLKASGNDTVFLYTWFAF